MHRIFAAAALVIALIEPAMAHHPMGGRLPGSFTEGLLSGLGHPIIGLDHLAAVLAIGALAAAHRAGVALALGYVVAMILGVAVHLQGVTLTGAEFLVAPSVILLGVLLARKSVVQSGALLGLFARRVDRRRRANTACGLSDRPDRDSVRHCAGCDVCGEIRSCPPRTAGAATCRRNNCRHRHRHSCAATGGSGLIIELSCPAKAGHPVNSDRS
jgi:hypothetical protein